MYRSYFERKISSKHCYVTNKQYWFDSTMTCYYGHHCYENCLCLSVFASVCTLSLLPNTNELEETLLIAMVWHHRRIKSNRWPFVAIYLLLYCLWIKLDINLKWTPKTLSYGIQAYFIENIFHEASLQWTPKYELISGGVFHRNFPFSAFFKYW